MDIFQAGTYKQIDSPTVTAEPEIERFKGQTNSQNILCYVWYAYSKHFSLLN